MTTNETIRIGRWAKRNPGDRLTAVAWQGSSLRLEGAVAASTLAEAAEARDQLRMLATSGAEDVVPVIWSGDPSIDGFYRVVGAQVDALRVSFAEGGRHEFRFDLDLDRVAGPMAVVETSLMAKVRTNALADTNQDVMIEGAPWAVPDAPGALVDVQREIHGGSGTRDYLDTLVEYVRTGAYRMRQFALGNDGTTFDAFDHELVWTCPVSSWYDGATEVRALGGQYPLVGIGHQVSTPDGAVISNGIIRATLHADGRIALDLNDGTGWVKSTAFVAGVSNPGGDPVDYQDVEVLENQPNSVTVRQMATYRRDGSVPVSWAVTVQLRRGDQYVVVTITSNQPLDELWVERGANEAGTGHTGGIGQASGSHRWEMACPEYGTRDLGSASTPAHLGSPGATADEFVVMLGYLVTGGDTRSANVANLRRQFLAGAVDHQQVIGS